MKILAAQRIEDCFDGSRVYRYQFDQRWSAQSIHCLGQLGELQYFPDFPRPYFRLRTRQGAHVSGLGDDDACRVVYPHKDQDQLKREMESWFASTHHP